MGGAWNPLMLRLAQHERIPRTPTDFLGSLHSAQRIS